MDDDEGLLEIEALLVTLGLHLSDEPEVQRVEPANERWWTW